MATKPCGQCELYHDIAKPKKDGSGVISTGKGHCLDKTVYAAGRPGNPVYPPRAKVAPLEFNRHQIALRRATEIRPECLAFIERK